MAVPVHLGSPVYLEGAASQCSWELVRKWFWKSAGPSSKDQAWFEGWKCKQAKEEKEELALPGGSRDPAPGW